MVEACDEGSQEGVQIQLLLLEDRPEKGHGELRVQFGCDCRQAKQAAQVAQSSAGRKKED